MYEKDLYATGDATHLVASRYQVMTCFGKSKDSAVRITSLNANHWISAVQVKLC